MQERQSGEAPFSVFSVFSVLSVFAGLGARRTRLVLGRCMGEQTPKNCVEDLALNP